MKWYVEACIAAAEITKAVGVLGVILLCATRMPHPFIV